MTRARLQWSGAAAVRQIRTHAARGLLLGAEHVLDEASRQVPLDEATLQRSGTVSVDRGSLTAAISYDTPYAVPQHERLDFRHLPGRKAKYLEDPLRDEAATVGELIAATIRRGIA